jgi:hypothetical protein
MNELINRHKNLKDAFHLGKIIGRAKNRQNGK